VHCAESGTFVLSACLQALDRATTFLAQNAGPDLITLGQIDRSCRTGNSSYSTDLWENAIMSDGDMRCDNADSSSGEAQR